MDTTEIARCLRRVNNFGGVYAVDKIPTNVTNKFYIFNIDPANKSGRHWIAMYFDKTPEYFDSLGEPPSTYNTNFENVLVNNGPEYFMNTQILQSKGSEFCGQYCVFCVTLRALGHSLGEILNYTSSLWPHYN